MKDFKYKTTFACKITKLTNTDFEKYISLASLDSLKKIMPKDINLEEKPNLIGFCANICNINICNKNGDCVSSALGPKLAKDFIYQLVDWEHKNSKVIGVLINTALSSFDKNEIITEEEALKSDYFNIAAAGLIFKSAIPEKVVEYIEKAGDETSNEFGALSCSWEIAFDTYNIAVGPRTLKDAKIVSGSEEIKKYEKYLQSFDGVGKTESGDYVYRVISEGTLTPLGIGIVENPAALIRGISVVEASISENDISQKNINNTSQLQNPSVKTNSEVMKITNRKDITDENLKVGIAAVDIDNIINSEIETFAKEYKAKQEAAENSAKEAKAAQEKIQADYNKLETEFKTVKEQLDSLMAKAAEKEKQEKFDQRMSYFDATYELDENLRKIIAKRVQNIDEPTFTDYQSEMAVFLKEKNKELIKASQEKAEKEKLEKEQAAAAQKVKEEQEKAKVAVASENKDDNKNVVADAVKDAEKTVASVPNNTAANQSIKEKYASAFGLDGWDINLSKTAK